MDYQKFPLVTVKNIHENPRNHHELFLNLDSQHTTLQKTISSPIKTNRIQEVIYNVR
jgi:hypothetical protein